MSRTNAALCAALLVAACTAPAPAPENAAPERHASGAVALTAEQIAAAGVQLSKPAAAASATAIDAPALLESDPEATRIVAATVEGRVIALTRNLGDTVARGQTLAVLESREGAALQAEVERSRARADLARATRARDEALYARGFRPLREVEISRAAATEAEVALKLAQQQVAASGTRGRALNRIAITAPIAGQVIARSAMLGQTFTGDATETELFRIANLGRLRVSLSVPAADAARVRVGSRVDVVADERRQTARVRFVAPVLDETTRLVRVLADLDNRAGLWRGGEPVQARITTGTSAPGTALMVPASAVQTIDGRPVVFVRTRSGFRVHPVTLGRRVGRMIVVTAGLSGAETIATANSFVIKAELGKSDAEHED